MPVLLTVSQAADRVRVGAVATGGNQMTRIKSLVTVTVDLTRIVKFPPRSESVMAGLRSSLAGRGLQFKRYLGLGRRRIPLMA